MSALTAEGLTRRFGDLVAVNNLTFEVPEPPRAAATELQRVGPAEALELTLLIFAKESMRFQAAALRWHARYCGDNKVTIEEATAVLGARDARRSAS